MQSFKVITMKNFKKRKYNSPDGSFLKNHDVSKKRKTDVPLLENILPTNWHEVKINLDATVVEKYLNNQKSVSTISPSHRDKILIRKIPRVDQNIFSEKNNVTVKLETPDDVKIDDNLSPTDTLVLVKASVKQENCIPIFDSLDNDTFHDTEFIEPLNKDFQDRDDDNFTAKAALKNEVIESESCCEEVIIGQEFTDELRNEELFVGEEFKHEEPISSYENVESIAEANDEEIIRKSTRSSRKKKKCLDCDDCNHGLLKKSRVPSKSKAFSPKLRKTSKTRSEKSKTPPKPSKPKSPLRAKKQKTNQGYLHIASPSIPKSKIYNYGVYRCAHCDYIGRRGSTIRHLRNKHPYLYPNASIRCSDCDIKFDSWEEIQRHRPVCLRFVSCKFCLVNETSRRAMVMHMKAVHPETMYGKRGERIVDQVGLYSMTAVETLELTPFGQRYMEIKKYYSEMESELIKLYCPKCAVTHDKIMSKSAPSCDICDSRLLFQCQKCKYTRAHYSFIWKHVTYKASSCGNSENVSIMDHEEVSNETYQASSNRPKRHDCEICDFKGSSTTHLDEHVLNVHMENGIIRNGYYTCSKCGASFHVGDERLKKHEELCGIAVRFPCRFCPMTCIYKQHLSHHIATMHPDELDGRDINEFLQEALDFKRMVKEVNLVRFNDKLRNGEAETERDYYHDGIESMLQPVCIKCKTGGPQEGEHCADCRASLNFVCLKCDKLFSKYSAAWVHVTRMCKKRCFTLTIGETSKYEEKKKIESTRVSFNESEGIIKRTFSENIKFASFYCQNCDDTVHKNYRFVADTRTCPKCNGKLRLHCKICSRAYSKWESIANHFQSTDCGNVNVETCNLDHLYCLRQPPAEVTK